MGRECEARGSPARCAVAHVCSSVDVGPQDLFSPATGAGLLVNVNRVLAFPLIHRGSGSYSFATIRLSYLAGNPTLGLTRPTFTKFL